jgi:polyphosphate kinase
MSRREPSDLYINRELSWLEFNSRVLDQCLDPGNLLLDRLRFLTIFASNLDEFFMIRVASLKKLLREGKLHCESPDHSPVLEISSKIFQRCQDLISQGYQCFHGDLLPQLKREGVQLLGYAQLSPTQKTRLNNYFNDTIFPVLTPLAVDPSHPYPYLANLASYIVAEFKAPPAAATTGTLTGFVEIPRVLPRLLPLEEGEETSFTFILLEELIQANLEQLFLGFEILSTSVIRVTRDFDYQLMEHNIIDLMESIKKEVLNKTHQEAVRLEVSATTSEEVISTLQRILMLGHQDIYRVPWPLALPDLTSLCALPLPHCREEEFNPRLPARLAEQTNIFSLIKEKDLLLHLPYESFYAVIEFLNSAAIDPQVLAIKQTLYRFSGDSPILDALVQAAENGKQVTVVIELKARFDERNNVAWAHMLERAGVNVVYGFVDLKTHCKASLVIRKENASMVRYVHLSTGNYNPQTARLYTDLALFTTDEGICRDISALFNLLTGFNLIGKSTNNTHSAILPRFSTIQLAPISLRESLVAEIDGVIRARLQHEESLIFAKINGLVDQTIIEKLYEASQAGVTIKLIVRGICCLRPQVKGLSENIEIISLVDRFLEHSRIYYFHAGSEQRVFLSSADWMNRSMDNRIEIMYPIFDPEVKERIINEILGTYWQDTLKAKTLHSDGSYHARYTSHPEKQVRAQTRFIEIAREEGIKSLPYDKAIRHKFDKKGRPVANKVIKDKIPFTLKTKHEKK